MEITGQPTTQTAVNTAPDASPNVAQPDAGQDTFLSSLKERTGFESPEQIKELASYKSQAEQRIAELEQKANANPFANDLARQVNDLLKAGKPMNEVIPFLSLQAQDFNSMDPAGLIKWQKKMEMPSWSDTDISDWFDGEYPMPDEDSEDAVRAKRQRELRISEKGEMARRELNQKKVDLTKPDPNEAARNEAMKASIDRAVQHAGKVIDSITEIPINEKVEKSEQGDGFEYNLSYKPNLDPQVKKNIVHDAIQNHLQSGGSLDEQGLSQVSGRIREVVFMLSARDIIKAVIHDTRSSMLEEVVKNNTNTRPVQKGVTPAPKQVQKNQPIVKVGGRTFA